MEAAIRDIQEGIFAAQLSEAESIREYERVLAGFILLMVLGATLYGHKIYKGMRVSAIERRRLIRRPDAYSPGISQCLMGWEIGVDSVYGEGTTFWMTGQLPRAEPPPLPNATSLKGVKMLFVDDNKEHQRIFKRMLEHMGADVAVISDPTKVLDRLQDIQPGEVDFKIVILDQGMSKKSGFEIGVEIRKLQRFDETKLLILSLSGQKGDVRIFKEAGFSTVLD